MQEFIKEIDIGQRLFFDCREKTKIMRYLYENFNVCRNELIWFAWIDGRVRNGWKNHYSCSRKIIIENNIDDVNSSIGLIRPYRHVFENLDLYKGEYEIIYRGKYELQSESTNTIRVLNLCEKQAPLSANEELDMSMSPLNFEGKYKIPCVIRTHPIKNFH